MTAQDFRFKRYKLPPEAFAIGPGKEPEPTDMVDEETWRNLVWLTDDVSLRTIDIQIIFLGIDSFFAGHFTPKNV